MHRNEIYIKKNHHHHESDVSVKNIHLIKFNEMAVIKIDEKSKRNRITFFST